MALGLCCQWLESTPKGLKNVLVSRSLQVGRLRQGFYSNDKIHQTFLANVQNLADVFPKIVSSGIRSFRISSSLIPLWDLVDRNLWDSADIKVLLRQIGSLAQSNKVRLTMHPGQFCVLSSDSDETVRKSVEEIEMHAWIMDQMGLEENPYYSINIHGGKSYAEERLIDGIKKLKPSARNRLTVENCEFAYAISHLTYVAEQTKVPLVFDSHHHSFNMGGYSGKVSMEAAVATWPVGIKPLTHVSNSKPEYLEKDSSVTKLREHSDMLHCVPEYQAEAHNKGAIDIDIEAKNKNVAIFNAVERLGLVLC